MKLLNDNRLGKEFLFMCDPYNIWNGKTFQFTLKKITKIVFEKDDYSIPDKFKKIENDIVKRVTADNMPNVKGIRVLFDLSWNKTDEESRPKVINYIKDGVIVFSNRTFYDENGQKLETIHIDEPWEAWVAIGKYVKDVFPMPTIAITGSTGKTTSTMFAQCVFNEKYNTFISGEDGKNYNTPLSIVNQWILRCSPEYNFHIQECGGETPDLIRTSARIIGPDAFAINNIDTRQHLATYGSPENLIKDKTSFDSVRKETAFGVINVDDEILKNHKFESPVTTYAVTNREADYVGENIRQTGEFLEFDVVSKEERVYIKINIVGKYNVYNALLVFALAKKFGLTNEEIQNGFLKYRSVGIRQNLREVAGRLIYMDCYNASPESTLLAVKTLSEFERKHRGRKIAVIGERRAANDEIYKINFELGQKLAEFDDIDEFIIVGEDPEISINDGIKKTLTTEEKKREKGIFEGICSVKSANVKVSFSTDLKLIAEKLKYQTKRGDAILFKGRAKLALWSIADIAFGTGYTVMPTLLLKGDLIKNDKYKGRYFKYFDGINLFWGKDNQDDSKLIIPKFLGSKPIVRIGDKMFRNNSQIRMVIFGEKVRSIGDEAFYNCHNIEEIQLPTKCVYLGDRSFGNCNNLVRVSALSIQHISAEAFKDCIKLKEVLLSESCMTIEQDAFDNCPDVIIKAPENSYAAKYAQEHKLNFEIINSDAEKKKLSLNGTRRDPNVYSVNMMEDLTGFELNSTNEENGREHLTVAFAGDIMVHDIHLGSFLDVNNGGYNFDKLFEKTAHYFKGADIAVGNVETTFGYGEYTAFPKFNTPENLAESMSRAGFDIAAVANNHMFDSKYAGIVRTRKVLETNDIAVAGVKNGKDEDRGIAILERRGIRVAVLNYTYRTADIYGQKSINFNPLDEESAKLVNSFSIETLEDDLARIESDISYAKSNADVVLVYYHWGSEYEKHSNIIQRYIARKTAEMGADAIIGSHAHVIQEEDSIEVEYDGKLKTVPVFYGMGNYCWGGRMPRTGRETVHNGIIAFLDIAYDKEKNEIESIKTHYVPLHIKNDYITDRYDFSILSLKDMNQFEIQAFNARSSMTVDEIKNEIELQLHPNAMRKSSFCFNEFIEIKEGEKKNIIERYFPDFQNAHLICQDVSVASVLTDGSIVGNAPGFAGVLITSDDGQTVECIIHVIKSLQESVHMPVLINDNNMVSDLYRPRKLC